jgi:hypothetical protein
MSFNLHNEGGPSFDCSGRVFSHLLQLAQEYGWVPAGTQLPPLCIQHQGLQVDRLDARVAHLKAAGQIAEALALERAYQVWDAEHERYVSHLPDELAVPCGCRDTWNGIYTLNDGQWVTDEDAGNLAAALEQALPDIPDEDALAHKLEPDPFEPDRWIVKEGEELTLPEFFFGEGKEWVREFIAFCRQGGFSIY